MATPRRHWFMVADSVAREPWDNNQLATFIRLLAYMNTRRSRDGLDADEATDAYLTFAEAAHVCSVADGRLAVRRLGTLSVTGVSSAVETISGRRYVHIKWPKLANFQGWTSRESPAEIPRASRELPSPTPGSVSVSVSGKKSKKRAPKTTIPESWPSDEERRALERWGLSRTPPIEAPEIELLIESFRVKCGASGTQYVNFNLGFQRQVNQGWLEVPRGTRGTRDGPESASQARVRRSLEAGAEAARILAGRQPLRAIAAGKRQP